MTQESVKLVYDALLSVSTDVILHRSALHSVNVYCPKVSRCLSFVDICAASSVTSTYISYPISMSHWEACDINVQNMEILAKPSVSNEGIRLSRNMAVQRITLLPRNREFPCYEFWRRGRLSWVRFFVVFLRVWIVSLRQNITRPVHSTSFEIHSLTVLPFKANLC